MKHTIFAGVAAAFLFAAQPALAGSCPKHINEINAYMATNPDVDKKTMGKAKGLLAKGEAMHKAGKHAESVEALMEAKKLLGMN